MEGDGLELEHWGRGAQRTFRISLRFYRRMPARGSSACPAG